MQLFTATFVKNKCIFLTILLQRRLALVISVVFGQVRVWDRKSAWQGGRGLGWSAGWGGCGLEVCGCGQNFSNSCECGRV